MSGSALPGGHRFRDGRHAVITGGGRGIGAAIGHELARLGASLTLMGRDRERLERQAETLRAEYDARVTTAQCDVADDGSVEAAFAVARREQGEPYILVNNAGVAGSALVEETRRALWDRILAIDLTGTMLCMQQVLPAMRRERAGRIVNVASTAGLKGYTKLAAYCAAKHGVIGLTKVAALETAKLGITVNAVCPGYTDSDMAQQAVDNIVATLGKTPEEALAIITRMSPRGTLTQTQEVANAVGWLCSPGASAITGQAIVVAGGEVM